MITTDGKNSVESLRVQQSQIEMHATMLIAKLIRAARYYSSYIGRAFVAERIESAEQFFFVNGVCLRYKTVCPR